MISYLKAYRKAVVTKINALQSGLIVAKTGVFPRVEIHSDLESTPSDKDYDERRVSVVIDCISNKNFEEATQIGELLLYGKDTTNAHTDGLIGVNTIAINGAYCATELVSNESIKELTDEDLIVYRQVIRIESIIS